MSQLKKIISKLSLMLCAVLVLSVLVPKTVDAASVAPTFPKSIGYFVEAKDGLYSDLAKVYNLGDGKITSVVSSKPNIVKIKFYPSVYPVINEFEITPLKAGTSKLTIKVEKGGKKYTLKSNVIVKSGTPFKNFSINGEKIADTKTSTYNMETKLKSNKTKITYKLASGYKMKTIKLQTPTYGEQVKITQNKSISTKKTGTYCINYIVTDKNGTEYYSYFDLYRY